MSMQDEASALLLAYGDDGFQLAAAVDQFATQIGALERTELRAERTPDEALIERAAMAAASVPLFGGVHLVVLHQPIRAAGRSAAAVARLTALVTELPAGAALALVDERTSRDAGRASGPLQQLADAVKAGGGAVVERNAPRRNELAAWITEHAAQLGLQMERRAAAVLAERLGGMAWESDIERGEQTRRADSEVRKLAVFARDRAISADDVALLVADTRPASVFAITNAVERREPIAAADALRRALADGQPPLLIMATLQSRISELIVARDLVARRVSTEQLVRRLGKPARAAERVTQAARRYSGGELEAMLRGLLEADIQIKSNAVDAESALTAWFGMHLAALGPSARRDGGARDAPG